MIAKLLIKLRNIGRSMVEINSVTKTNGTVTGMCYGFNEDEYGGLFDYGDTEQIVKDKAAKIYLQTNIDFIRKKYSKKNYTP